jgi:hypothetical protein
MRDADEFGLLAERYVGPLVLKPDRALGLEARYGDAHELVEEDASIRVGSALWHEFKASPGLRHNLCGIIIPQVIAASICAHSGTRRNVGSSRTGMLSTAVTSQAAVHRHRFAVADAPANVIERVKADQKAFNLGSGYRGIIIAP